jgi:hypothetical protein
MNPGQPRRLAFPPLIGILLTLSLSLPLAAQNEALEQPGMDRRTLRAESLELAPELDGAVVGDPAWALVEASSGFVQNTPDEGEPASERTEVRVGFTDDTLFVGVVCHDRSPEEIIVAESRRDASLSESDSFQIVLDTYLDRQSGFVFGTNPAGIEFDGQVTGATEGGLSAGNTFNRNWDGAWEVRTLVSDSGWSAEFAIPFRTLRYATRQAHPAPQRELLLGAARSSAQPLLGLACRRSRGRRAAGAEQPPADALRSRRRPATGGGGRRQ